MIRQILTAGAAVLLAAALAVAPGSGVGGVRVEAATSTVRVTGTVESGTTDTTLYLKLKDGSGVMQIRMDSDTDRSQCRLLIVGADVTADVYRGSDAYMHASRLLSGIVATTDSSDSTTVTGTVAAGTTDTLLLLDTAQGTMKIKIDSSTNLTDAGILYPGKPLSVEVVRGSDAYMHATSIAYQVQSSHPGAVTVTGKVLAGTTQSILYLDTSDGAMQIKIDSDTDTQAGMVLVTGNTVSVDVYRGSDAYMHAAKIVGSSDTANTSGMTTVRGAVSTGSTSNLLHLLTEQGVMLIKLDSSTDMSACGILLEGQYLYVDVARGSDAYMHAIRIVNPYYTSSTSGTASTSSATYANAREVTGTPKNNSTDDILYLDTSEGTFTLKLDSSTEMASKAFMTGHTTKVTIYPGSDAYYHAAKITDDQYKGNQANVSSSTRDVEGTVSDGTSLNELRLNTSEGTYKLRIDKSTTFDGVRFLKEGRKLKVTIARGDDEYWHAVKVTAAK